MTSVALKHEWWISPEEYLEGEEVAPTKHEYVGGIVYAMAGARNRHNQIALNALVEVGLQLRGRPCQPCNSDTKVRIRRSDDVRFYYPDAMVVCEPNDPDEVFQDRPVVIFEVISESTARTDREEKLRAYQSIPTLRVYAIVESERVGITCYRREDESAPWQVALCKERADSLSLAAIGCDLSMEALYARSGL
jgi:Uma2 family endonuclease